MDENVSNLIYSLTVMTIFSIVAACLKKYFDINISRIDSVTNVLRDRVNTHDQLLSAKSSPTNNSPTSITIQK